MGQHCPLPYTVIQAGQDARSIASQFDIPVQLFEINNYCNLNGPICPPFPPGTVSFLDSRQKYYPSLIPSLNRWCALQTSSLGHSRGVRRSWFKESSTVDVQRSTHARCNCIHFVDVDSEMCIGHLFVCMCVCLFERSALSAHWQLLPTPLQCESTFNVAGPSL